MDPVAPLSTASNASAQPVSISKTRKEGAEHPPHAQWARPAGRILACLLASPALSQPVPRIQQAKTLTCAIDQGTPDYTTEDPHGPRIAFDLELCHAVAVAIAGPEAKVLPLLLPDEASTREALRTGKADLIPTTSLKPAPKDILLGPPILLDAVGFLVPNAIPDARSLSGKKVCFFAETPTEQILRTWFTEEHLDFIPFPFSEEGEMQAAFMTGNCPAVAGDLTRLADLRQGSGSQAASSKLLPETIFPDPLGPATTDPALQRIVARVYTGLQKSAALSTLYTHTLASLPSTVVPYP